jgi:hypothetical protein
MREHTARVSNTSQEMKLTFSIAAQDDVDELAALHTAAADLTSRHGRGGGRCGLPKKVCCSACVTRAYL